MHPSFDHKGRYILEDYDQLKPLSNFLPGIAGLDGIPMWVFYVNRGQGVSSFGTASKDQAMMEFQPANKAYRLTPKLGFRTFIKSRSSGENKIFEPFSDLTNRDRIARNLYIGIDEFEIEEINQVDGFKVNVLYYMLPRQDFSALVRIVTIRNISQTSAAIELLDGMPVVIPFGVDSFAQKNMSRTAEAWMEVFNLSEGLPYFKVRASMGDTAQVDTIRAGNFATALLYQNNTSKYLSPIVDPQVLFGPQLSFSHPVEFSNKPVQVLNNLSQRTLGFTPCAFFGDSVQLAPDEEIKIYSIYGNCESLEKLAEIHARLTPEFLERGLLESHQIIEDLTARIDGKTANPVFDAYARQTYLDNVLRGGKPIILPGGAVYHVYSRKHGDPERDYNFFYLAPEFYSQGNGNYRDVNQNRRSDVLFEPNVGDYNLRFFLSLLQLDGYNPLEIRGTRFVLTSEAIRSIVSSAAVPQLGDFLAKPFTPGSLLNFLYQNSNENSRSPSEVFELVFPRAEQIIDAVHGEGFWIDHWTYNLDLLDSYLAVFPEKKLELFFGKRDLLWYESYAKIQPPEARYQTTAAGIRQYQAVVEDEDLEAAIKRRGSGQTWKMAGGEAYKSSVFEKLLILLALKSASLDQAGMGMEMEAGKPGWYDALNGFPGLLGSSIPETYETLRLADYLASVIGEVDTDIRVPIEFGEFLESLVEIFTDGSVDPLSVWRKTSALRNLYRNRVYSGITGQEKTYHSEQLKPILRTLKDQVEKAVGRVEALQPGLPATYLYYEANQTGEAAGGIDIDSLIFDQRVLPDFLEGPVHALRVADKDRSKKISEAVRNSGLFDEPLGMYKVNASLEGVTHEVGRTTAFPPGWLENESVWLHMEYKYLLELLRSGLYEAFYEDILSALVPFQPVERYGRSPLENSSFIASSAYPDENLHGAGFVARLSGSTAEFLSMWFEMFAGRKPFVVRDGKLILELKPALPSWFFSENEQVEFTFLGHTRVIYHNPTRLDTWHSQINSIQIRYHDGQETMIQGGFIPYPYSADVRAGKVKEISAHLGEGE